MTARARSGREADAISLAALRAGDLAAQDIRIHPETLEHQAAVAEEHGNPQLAENFRRAAELVDLTDEEVLEIYEALRPGRSSYHQLMERAESLAGRGAGRTAALVREAAEVYRRRGLLT